MSNQVTLSYDPAWTALEWAKQHCTSYITHTSSSGDMTIIPNPYHLSRIMYITYYFTNERDATMFRLRWA